MITADNLPVGFRASQVGVVGADTANPVITLEWTEGNVGPYIQSEDGTTSTLVTETIMTGYASSNPNSASETFYFTGGTLPAGTTRQIQYTATVRGLPNGQKSNPPTTAFAANKILHSDESFYVVNEAPWVKSLESKFDNALAEVETENDLIAMSLETGNRANKQDIQDQLDTFETSITDQQNTFETTINSEFDNFTATQRDITAIINAETSKFDISSGVWLDGDVERTYAGVTGQSAVLSNTRYYELTRTTGALNVATGNFTSGAYPIAKITADGSAITSIVNYGAAYQANRAVVTTSAGAGDVGKVPILDSTGVLDTSVIPVVSAFKGFDFNCPWDITDGFDTFQVAASATYTVPVGKVALVENVACGAISNLVNVDSVEMFKGAMNRDINGPSEKLATIVPFAAGTDISPDAGSAAQGIICNANANITPVVITLNTATSYTVPSGKVLRALWWKNISMAELTLDGANIWFNASGEFSASPSPFFAKDGDVLACLSGATDTYVIGYLIPDDFDF